MRMSLSAGADYTPLARSSPSQSVTDKGLTGAAFPPAATQASPAAGVLPDVIHALAALVIWG